MNMWLDVVVPFPNWILLWTISHADSKTKAKRFSKRLEAKKIKEKESAKIPSSEPEGKIQTAPPAPSVSPFQLGIDLKNSEKVIVSPRGRPSIHQGNKKQKKRPTEESLMSPPPAPPPPPPPPPPAGILKDSTNKVWLLLLSKHNLDQFNCVVILQVQFLCCDMPKGVKMKGSLP